MKNVRIELAPEEDEEVIIRCHSLSPEIIRLQQLIENENGAVEKELSLTLGSELCFVKIRDILFFESYGRQIYAHSALHMYGSNQKLYELEEMLPRNFMRISKSVIINLNSVSAIRRDFTGNCEVSFKNTNKKTTVSRMYYKPFIEKLKEMRL